MRKKKKHAERLLLPLGFCPACLGLLSRGALSGAFLKLPRAVIAGGYCPHNEVAAIRTELSDQVVGPWRMISPANEADLREMMRRAAGIANPPPLASGTLH